ncbi:MAG: hypothetical protein R3D98_10370 [Candidatus Krumholzibacteriia bacterium]
MRSIWRVRLEDRLEFRPDAYVNWSSSESESGPDRYESRSRSWGVQLAFAFKLGAGVF